MWARAAITQQSNHGELLRACILLPSVPQQYDDPPNYIDHQIHNANNKLDEPRETTPFGAAKLSDLAIRRLPGRGAGSAQAILDAGRDRPLQDELYQSDYAECQDHAQDGPIPFGKVGGDRQRKSRYNGCLKDEQAEEVYTHMLVGRIMYSEGAQVLENLSGLSGNPGHPLLYGWQVVVVMPVRFALEHLEWPYLICHARDVVSPKQVGLTVRYDRLNHFGKYAL